MARPALPLRGVEEDGATVGAPTPRAGVTTRPRPIVGPGAAPAHVGPVDRPRVARPAPSPVTMLIAVPGGQVLAHLPMGVRAAGPAGVPPGLAVPASPLAVTVALDTLAVLPTRVDGRAWPPIIAPLARAFRPPKAYDEPTALAGAHPPAVHKSAFIKPLRALAVPEKAARARAAALGVTVCAPLGALYAPLAAAL